MDGSSLAAIIRPSQPTQGSVRFDRRMPTTYTKSGSPTLSLAITEGTDLSPFFQHALGGQVPTRQPVPQSNRTNNHRMPTC
jgi:hypothetical protein